MCVSVPGNKSDGYKPPLGCSDHRAPGTGGSLFRKTHEVKAVGVTKRPIT